MILFRQQLDLEGQSLTMHLQNTPHKAICQITCGGLVVVLGSILTYSKQPRCTDCCVDAGQVSRPLLAAIEMGDNLTG